MIQHERRNQKNSFVKYSNTITTDYYNKAATLFLIDHAVREIGITKEAIVFEGYTDVLACHKHEYKNTVAMGSAAFSQQHLDLLVDCGAETLFVLCLDNDDGGIKEGNP